MQVAMTPKRPPIQMNGQYIPPAPNMMPSSVIHNVNDGIYPSEFSVPPSSQLQEVEKRGEEIRTQKQIGPQPEPIQEEQAPEPIQEEQVQQPIQEEQVTEPIEEEELIEEEVPETSTTDIPQEEGTS
jgi:hypothetical protein